MERFPCLRPGRREKLRLRRDSVPMEDRLELFQDSACIVSFGESCLQVHVRFFLSDHPLAETLGLITLTLLKSNGGAPSETVTGFPEQIAPSEMLWVDAESPTDQELADLRQRFGLDEYAVEDVVHRNQRPKMEDYGKNVFAVIHVPVVK